MAIKKMPLIIGPRIKATAVRNFKNGSDGAFGVDGTVSDMARKAVGKTIASANMMYAETLKAT